MSEVTLYGAAGRTYVRTCRMALDEKGVAYTHDPVMPQTPEQLARHPWGKIPAFRHGEVALFESPAITRYVDATFDGPALQPADATGRARMDQWITAYIDYMYRPIVRQIVIQRVVVPASGGTPDENMIAAAVPDAAHCLGVLDAALGDAAFLAGDALSLADLFVLPAVNYVAMVPEGPGLLEAAPNVGAWRRRMEARNSAQLALAA